MSNRTMKPGNVHQSLVSERRRASFLPHHLTYLLDGSKQQTDRKQELRNYVLSDKEFQHDPISYLSREDRYSLAVKKSARCVQLFHQYEVMDPFERSTMLDTACPFEAHPFSLHTSMFLPTLLTQGTDELQEAWLEKAMNYHILGTYAQTELGHGTFIRGLETTATYDAEKKEFVLHSPTLTSMKWWPGALGKTVNFGIVVAQLYTRGECYGPHTFMVQLRSLENHKPLPGITIGDIGPKFGYENVDNGFLQFTHHRIPYNHLLMKHNKMSPDGVYQRSVSAKLTYGTMVMIRAFLVTEVSRFLSAAVTIATRYSAIRQQGRKDGKQEETTILDYRTQQYKLMPLIATCVGYNLVGQYMTSLVMSYMYGYQNNGDTQLLPEIHALSAGVKSFTATTCVSGIETCRLACGGHGYSEAGGVAKLYREIVAACTYEGENTVMLLQTARYLMKCYSEKPSVQSNSSIYYLTQPVTSRGYIDRDVRDCDVIEAYRHRAQRLVTEVAVRLRSLISSGMKNDDAWDECSVQLVHAAKAHCHYFLVEMFHRALEERIRNEEAGLVSVLRDLFSLYACHGLVENLADFIQDGFLSKSDVDEIRHKLDHLITKTRVQCVTIVDGFDIPDQMLNSVLGRYDGQVYENLVQFAKRSPLNKTDVHSSYHKYLKPMFKSHL